jgi:hypothetical protein
MGCWLIVDSAEEISRLGEVFHGILPKVPEMGPLLASLRRYCMGDETFDEADFERVVKVFLHRSKTSIMLTRFRL